MILAWREDGSRDAPPLVLLNSVGTTTECWTPCVAPLAEHFRVVRIDTRGHGSSPAAVTNLPVTIDDLATDVVDTMDELEIPRADLAGVSLGAMIAMWLGAHRPERVRRLGLVATAAHLPTASSYLDRAAAVRAGGMAVAVDGSVRRWITPALAGRDAELVGRLRAMFLGIDAESYAQCCEALGTMDLRPDLARIAAPTVVLAGAQDEATPPALMREIAAGIAGARLQLLEPAAHLATVEQPGVIARELLEHFSAGATLAAGYATRRAVLGDAHVERSVAATSEFNAPFQQFLTRYAWGDVWSRPGLGRRERSIVTLAALVTLGAEHELGMHVRAARRNGLSADEIAEVLLHTALYAGLPRANRAFAIAKEVLELDEG